jgi:hypothetical protein
VEALEAQQADLQSMGQAAGGFFKEKASETRVLCAPCLCVLFWICLYMRACVSVSG